MIDLKTLAQGIKRAALLMVGLPDYQRYCEHRRRSHPGEPVMSYEEFFREREQSRYGGGTGKINRCC